jgi:hypothetical protein
MSSDDVIVEGVSANKLASPPGQRATPPTVSDAPTGVTSLLINLTGVTNALLNLICVTIVLIDGKLYD